MSQEQPRRRGEDKELHGPGPEQEPIKYGEVFNVSSELASKPIAPRDAAIMQSAESQILGHTQKGGPAALMESAAAYNERAGLVSHDAVTHVARNEGVAISKTREGGNRLVTETVGGQVVGQYGEPDEGGKKYSGGYGVSEGDGDAAWTEPSGFRATQDDDFIREQGATTLTPRLLPDQDHNSTLFYVSSDKRDTGEGEDNVISSIPGGMGASMATADHRVSKNK